MKKSILLFLFLPLLLSDCHIEIPEVTTADITVQNENCAAPCEVILTSNARKASAYRWDFGDGGSSTDVNPSHLYVAAGSYVVKLVITGGGGSTGTSRALTIKSGIPVKVWDRTLGGSDSEFSRSMAATADGGFVLLGYSDSNASFDMSESSKGASDYWVVKIDASGRKVWDKNVGGSSYDNPRSIVATADGGFVLLGGSISSASGDKSENSKGETDYWVVKIDASGRKVWDRTLGGSGSDYATSMVATADGGFVLLGGSFSNASGDKSENSKGETDYWVVKIDASGRKVWDRTLGGSGDDVPTSVVATADGGFVLAGYSTSSASGDKSENSKGSADYWVVKIDASGRKVWDRTLGGSGNDYANSIVATADGGFVLAGQSGSGISGDKSENSKGGDDYWIVKIDASGRKVWDRTLGGGSDDYATSIVATTDGGFVLAGISGSGISGDKSENSKGGDDYWVVKIDASGRKAWDRTLGGSGRDYATSIVATVDGGFVLLGYSTSNASGDKIENSKGEGDYWVVKIK